MGPFPGTYVEESKRAPPLLPFESLATALLIGNAAAGPAGTPHFIASLADYQAVFGGSPPATLLDHGIRQYFGNGGRQAVAIRIEAPLNSAAFNAALLAAIADASRTDAIRDVGVISVPGMLDGATITALQAFACREGKFLLIDAGQGADAAAARQQSAALRNDASFNSAFYYPWLDYAGLSLPPGPVVAGIIASTDRARGCWKSPAGMEATVAGATGLSRPVTASDQDLLNPEGVCCLRQDSVTSPVRVWGARTLASAGHAEWRYIAVRRMALALRNSLGRGLLWTVFEPNDSRLWASLGQTVGSMLSGLFRQGAFQGQTGKDSFYVRCGLGVTMSQADLDAGRAIVELGFAPLKPAEFVVLRISCKAGSA